MCTDKVYDSKTEKMERSPEFIEHWLFVKELKDLINGLDDGDWVVPNDVHNLAVYREVNNEDVMIGFIDFFMSELVIFNNEEKEEEEECKQNT